MVHSEVNNTKLVLVSARKSRGEDHWDKDDYDVRFGDGKRTISRSHHAPPAGTGEATVVLDNNRAEQPPSVYNHGYAASREEATRYFKARLVHGIGQPI
jgi:hypothetical protein